MREIKLFCLPYACGSTGIYFNWNKLIDNRIKIYPIEFNGRGTKLDRPFYRDINDAVENLLPEIVCEIDDCEYAFFGHSMGAIISYELAQAIGEKRIKQPCHLFFSGQSPLHIEKRNKTILSKDDETLIAELKKIGGTPTELFKNADFLKMYLPIVRADSIFLETYPYERKEKNLKCDITIFAADDDEKAPAHVMDDWAFYTDGASKVYQTTGGHLFINEKTDFIIDIINRIMINPN